MGLFNTRKPRGFRRVSIYTDERKEKLDKLVNQVKREQGEQIEEKYDPTKFNGTFINYTPNAKKHKERSYKLAWPVALIIIVLLVMVWRYLLTGHIHF